GVTRVAVGRGSSTEMIPVHAPVDPFALGDTGALPPLPPREDRDGPPVARLGRVARERETLEPARHPLEARRFHVPGHRLHGALRLLRLEAELHAVAGDLYDRARPGLDHRDGHVRAVFHEDPGHAEFAADKCVHSLASTEYR